MVCHIKVIVVDNTLVVDNTEKLSTTHLNLIYELLSGNNIIPSMKTKALMKWKAKAGKAMYPLFAAIIDMLRWFKIFNTQKKLGIHF